jgi:hypothetical protein
VYYGDEQGFAGTGGDQDARQDMFATLVATYRADRRIGVAAGSGLAKGSAARTASGEGRDASFDRTHPIYRAIAALSALRSSHEALRRGRQVVRAASGAPGLFAVSRIGPERSPGASHSGNARPAGHAAGIRDASEIVIAFNTSLSPVTAALSVEPGSGPFRALRGECAPSIDANGRYSVAVPPLDFIACATGAPQ